MIFGVSSFVLIRAFAYAFTSYIAFKYNCKAIGALFALLTLSAIHPEIIPFELFYEVILLGFPMASLWVAWDIIRRKS